MKDREAISIAIVIRSAEGWAGGHQDCLKIHSAIKRVRALLSVIGKKSASSPSKQCPSSTTPRR